MAKEKTPKPFEIKTMGHLVELKLGHCVCNLFRLTPDVDYLAVDIEDDERFDGDTLRIFNNEDLVRWMAGIAFKETHRGNFMPGLVEMNDTPFRETYHWNPAVIIRDEPSEVEQLWWTELQVDKLDEEWASFDG